MNKAQRGYALLSLVFVFIALLTAATVPIVLWIERDQAIELEQWQFHLHDARLELILLRAEKPAGLSLTDWALSTPVLRWQQRLEQQGIQVTIPEDFHSFMVDLGNARRAQQLERRLVNAAAVGTMLRLELPEDQNRDGSLWLARSGLAQMATDLDLAGFRINAVRRLDGQQLYAPELRVQERFEAKRIETDAVRFFGLSTLEAQTLLSEEIYSTNMSISAANSDYIEAREAQTGGIGAKQLFAESAVINDWQTEALSSSMVSSGLVNINGPLRIREEGMDLLATTAQRLQVLEQNMTECIEVSQWCLAAELPELQMNSCNDCTLEQYEEWFESSFQVFTQSCLHGCAFSVNQPTGTELHCTPLSIPAKTTGYLNCSIRGRLVEGQQRSILLAVFASSMKDSSLLTKLDVSLQWQRRHNRCESFDYIMPIVNSVPPLSFGYVIPAHGPSQWFSDAFYENECDIRRPSSRMDCEVSAYCSAEFEWENVEGSCICT